MGFQQRVELEIWIRLVNKTSLSTKSTAGNKKECMQESIGKSWRESWERRRLGGSPINKECYDKRDGFVLHSQGGRSIKDNADQPFSAFHLCMRISSSLLTLQ